jgi:hypothetical protein
VETDGKILALYLGLTPPAAVSQRQAAGHRAPAPASHLARRRLASSTRRWPSHSLDRPV